MRFCDWVSVSECVLENSFSFQFFFSDATQFVSVALENSPETERNKISNRIRYQLQFCRLILNCFNLSHTHTRAHTCNQLNCVNRSGSSVTVEWFYFCYTRKQYDLLIVFIVRYDEIVIEFGAEFCRCFDFIYIEHIWNELNTHTDTHARTHTNACTQTHSRTHINKLSCYRPWSDRFICNFTFHFSKPLNFISKHTIFKKWFQSVIFQAFVLILVQCNGGFVESSPFRIFSLFVFVWEWCEDGIEFFSQFCTWMILFLRTYTWMKLSCVDRMCRMFSKHRYDQKQISKTEYTDTHTPMRKLKQNNKYEMIWRHKKKKKQTNEFKLGPKKNRAQDAKRRA